MLNYVPAQQTGNTLPPPPQLTNDMQSPVTKISTEKNKDNSSFPQTSDRLTSTTADSLSTPLVNKSDSILRSSKSFTSMLFGTSDSENTASNGSVSEGEDTSLKAH